MSGKAIDILIDVNNREKFSKMKVKEIAKSIGCTASYVYFIFEKYNIPYIKRSEWTTRELELLKKYRKGHSTEELVKILDYSKDKSQIGVKISLLELGSFLDDDYIYVTTVLRELGYSDMKNILKKWIKLGLKVKYKQLSKKYTYKIVKITDVIQFLKDNQDIWTARNVNEGFLGIEEKWFLEKVKSDKEKIIPKKNSWSKEVQYQMYLLKQMGYKNVEIAELFDAPANSVGNYVHNLENQYARDFITMDQLKKVLSVSSNLLEQFFTENEIDLNSTISSSKDKYVRIAQLNNSIEGHSNLFGVSKDEIDCKIHKCLVKR